MTWKTVLSSAEKFVTDNSPGILTGLAVAGAITTTVLTGRAAYRTGMDASTQYHEALEEGEPLPAELLENKYLLKTYWKEFIPAGVALTATVTGVIMANQIGSRRAAAIAAAFKLSEQLSEEYKERVVKTLGLQKEEKMRSELAADQMARTPGSDLIIVAGAESIFFDELSGQYFKAEMETVRKAVNDINYQVNNSYYASLSDFYDMIGLTKTKFSDEVGWNTDELLEVQYGATLLQDGRPAISINYNKTPVRGFDRCQ
jgi:hypothetical protein